MKKIITIAFVGMFGVMTLGSCFKTRNCECVTVYAAGSGSSYAGTTETNNSPVMGFKSGAKASCESGNSSTSYSTVTCKLKK